VRLALVALAVLAVVLPTTLIPEAAAHGNRYSAQQVLRVFRRAGIALERIPLQRPGRYEAFSDASSPNDFQLDVNVYPYRPRPGMHSRYAFASVLIVSTGSSAPPPPAKWKSGSTQRGNVSVFWSWSGGGSKHIAAVRAALKRLRYSTEDATLAAPPTIVLHAGQSRTLDTSTAASAAEEIDCDYAGAQAGWVPRATEPTPPLLSGTFRRNEALLRSQSGSGTSALFSCQGKHVTGTQLNPGGPVSVCHPGPGTVRLGRFEARVPRGWYFATSTESTRKDIWIGDLRGCAGLRPFTPPARHVYVQLSQVELPQSFPVSPSELPHQRAKRFLIHPGANAATRWIRGFGLYGRTVFSGTAIYSVTTVIGRGLRNARGVRIANAVLRGVTLRPR